MSFQSIDQAFRTDVSPSHKLLLLALANFADEIGRCWPSVNRLAQMTGYTARSIHRLLSDLEAFGCITRQPRFGLGGQRTSSLIQLFPDVPKGDKVKHVQDERLARECPEMFDPDFDEPVCKSPPAEADRGTVTPASAGTDTGVIQTSTEQKTINHHHNNHGASADLAEVGDDLVFPDALSASARVGASQILVGYPAARAQELLDELAGRMLAGGVRVSPLGYLRKLVEIERAGNFIPELAASVAATRERKRHRKIVEPVSPPRPASTETVKQNLMSMKKTLGVRGSAS